MNLTNIKTISLNVDPINKFDDYEIDNLVPTSIIDEFVSTNIDEPTLLRLHKDEKLKLVEKDYITLESNLTNPKTISYIPLNKNLVRRDRDNDFNNFSLSNISSITLNSQAANDNEVITKAYVDQFHQENERTRRDVGLDFYDETNNLVKNNQNNDFNNNEFTNIKSIEINDTPTNDNHAVNKKYIDSKSREGLKQDPNTIILSSSDIIPILVNTFVGEKSFPMATKEYVDKRVFNELQIITKFSNNNGEDLWTDWDLEISSGMNSLTGFFKSSNSTTGSGGTGPDFLPQIGEYYAFIETSNPNNGSDRYALQNIQNIKILQKLNFWYHRKGSHICRFKLQYETLDYQWEDKVTFSAGQLTDEWELLEETFSEDNRGIRFLFR